MRGAAGCDTAGRPRIPMGGLGSERKQVLLALAPQLGNEPRPRYLGEPPGAELLSQHADDVLTEELFEQLRGAQPLAARQRQPVTAVAQHGTVLVDAVLGSAVEDAVDPGHVEAENEPEEVAVEVVARGL